MNEYVVTYLLGLLTFVLVWGWNGQRHKKHMLDGTEDLLRQLSAAFDVKANFTAKCIVTFIDRQADNCIGNPHSFIRYVKYYAWELSENGTCHDKQWAEILNKAVRDFVRDESLVNSDLKRLESFIEDNF
jgi:hypothetical protein